ncbi:hypothetical protein GCM10017788_20700 [Amycolatopsis acidiphila]|nr:hypothetical protein GCM10017788_20700 [Amycolatopsis acidiphila]
MPGPCAPQLTALLHKHLERFGTASDGRLFRSLAGGLDSAGLPFTQVAEWAGHLAARRRAPESASSGLSTLTSGTANRPRMLEDGR